MGFDVVAVPSCSSALGGWFDVQQFLLLELAFLFNQHQFSHLSTMSALTLDRDDNQQKVACIILPMAGRLELNHP